MIGVGVAGAGVEQNAQALAIEHQPRQKRGQQRGRERKLIHRLRMRSDWRVMPSPERHIREGRCHAFAQPRRTVAARYRIVIDVSMIMLDDLGIAPVRLPP